MSIACVIRAFLVRERASMAGTNLKRATMAAAAGLALML